MAQINDQEQFTVRPEIDEQYLAPTGNIVAIAAIWPGGVVFNGGEHCTAFEFAAYYKPACGLCGGFHEPQYPHELSNAYNAHIHKTKGRAASIEDSLAHCVGLVREAATLGHTNTTAQEI
ncbi:MAG: hypothetical protein KAJ19_05010 [Gammaproteobacteria bacterium]|nr:hypothetical protein [Gammaproteobacteria bacterium]